MPKNYPVLHPGDAVMLPITKECGRVVATWQDKYGTWDCYVAFFGVGKKSLAKKPTEKPYVLRYYASSLKLLDTCDDRELEYYTL